MTKGLELLAWKHRAFQGKPAQKVWERLGIEEKGAFSRSLVMNNLDMGIGRES